MTTPARPAVPDWLHEAAYRVANGDTERYSLASGFALIGWEAGHLAARQHLHGNLADMLGTIRPRPGRRHPNNTGRAAARPAQHHRHNRQT